MMIEDYHISLAYAMYNAARKIKRIGEKFLHGKLVSYGILLLLIMDKQFE